MILGASSSQHGMNLKCWIYSIFILLSNTIILHIIKVHIFHYNFFIFHITFQSSLCLFQIQQFCIILILYVYKVQLQKTTRATSINSSIRFYSFFRKFLNDTCSENASTLLIIKHIRHLFEFIAQFRPLCASSHIAIIVISVLKAYRAYNYIRKLYLVIVTMSFRFVFFFTQLLVLK